MKKSTLLWASGGLVGLIAARIALPRLLTVGANLALKSARVPARIGRVRLSMLKSALIIDDFYLLGAQDRPGLAKLVVDRAWTQWDWRRALFGEIALSIGIQRPRARVLLESPMPKTTEGRMIARQSLEQKAAPSVSPFAAIARRFDIHIERLAIEDGVMTSSILAADPPVHERVSDIQLLARHLRSRPASAKPLLALSAHVPGGKMQASLRAEPFEHPPKIDLLVELDRFDLTTLNMLSERVAKAHLQSGHLSLFAEMHTDGEDIRGHVKPLLHDVEVAPAASPVKAAWDKLLDVGAQLMKNDSRDQIATDVPVRGKLPSPDIGLGAAIVALLENAFDMAIEPGFAPVDAPARFR